LLGPSPTIRARRAPSLLVIAVCAISGPTYDIYTAGVPV
jgi:hypothetical protein